MNRKKMIHFAQTHVTGLDIGSASVKLVQLRKNQKKWTVTAAAAAEITETAKDDKKFNEANISKAINDCIDSAGIQTSYTVCSVSGKDVAVRNFSFPLLPQEEVRNAVYLEAMQVCPFNMDNAALDYQLISDGQKNINGIFAAAANQLIEKKCQFAKKTGFQTVLIDIDGLALLNCFSELQKPGHRNSTAILNVGYSYANLIIIDRHGQPFLRDIPHAGREIIKKITALENTSTETAKKDLSPAAIRHQMPEACRELVCDIIETFRYHTTQTKFASIETLFICGGFAMVGGFAEALDGSLPHQVLLWNPMQNLHFNMSEDKKKIALQLGPSLAVATGLAMRPI